MAFSVENVGEQPHQLMMYKVSDELDIAGFFQTGDPPFESATYAASVLSLEPGSNINVAFTTPLASGRYALVCLLPDLDDPDGKRHVDNGMVAEFTIP